MRLRLDVVVSAPAIYTLCRTPPPQKIEAHRSRSGYATPWRRQALSGEERAPSEFSRFAHPRDLGLGSAYS